MKGCGSSSDVVDDRTVVDVGSTRAGSSRKGKVSSMMTIRDVMTATVVTVQPEMPLKEVAWVLIDNGISGVPVVDADGVILGVVSEADLLVKEQGSAAIRHRRLARLLGESRESRAQTAKLAAVTAAEAMTSPPITITPGRAISAAAAIMTARHVNRLPVIDQGQLVGIVSRADLVRAYVRTDSQLEATIRDDVILRSLWLDPTHFTVVVKDGVASIDGKVERRSTAEMIEEAVRLVPGVVDARVAVRWSMDDAHIKPATTDPFVPYSPH